MTNCRECQAEVSTSAKACSQCGADKPAYGNVMYGIEATVQGLRAIGCFLILLGLLLTLGLMLMPILVSMF